MKFKSAGIRIRVLLILVFLLVAGAGGSEAAIDGVSGLTTFNLTAKADYITTPDGGSIFMWGYALNNGVMQYPGPTLIVNEGDSITIKLTNELNVPVSIVFPGQVDVAATGGRIGLLTREAPAYGGTVSYTFTASRPGTFMYHSGTSPELQIEMGLVGAIIVRPAGFDPLTNKIAYGDPSTQFDREFLFLLTEIDPRIHKRVELGKIEQVDTTKYFPVYWFINGRAAPDTMLPANAPWLPTQPYNCMPAMRAGEKTLMRLIGAGRDLHPFHTHGNHSRVIAQDAGLLMSGAVDLSEKRFTNTVAPGQTIDAIFEWTGAKLGWDVYGPVDTTCTDTDNDGRDDATLAFCHDATCTDVDSDGFDDATKEYCADHGKPFPVTLPSPLDLTFGQFYSGSPFLGALGALPPGEGGFNLNGGFFFMWHSHTEKEIVNNDIFPGGMLTMMVVEHPFVEIME